MPIEPNPKTDDLLKRYARQRRAEAHPPLELSPSTRSLLQAEVARTFHPGPSTRSSRLIVVHTFWPRLLLGGAGLAALLIAAGLWLRYDEQHEREFAKTQESNLLLFAQSASGTVPSPDRSALPEQLREFQLAAPAPMEPTQAAEKPSSADSSSVPSPAVTASSANLASNEPVDSGRIDLALALPATPRLEEAE